MAAPAMPAFRGLSAFPITPADADGHVDAAALRILLDRLVKARVDSIGLLGSTGTYPYLSRPERRRAVKTAVELVAGRIPVMVGIGALRTDDAVRLGQDAADAGADAVLLAPVSYAPLTEDEVFAHFETVAGAVGLPLCIYNNPSTTHFSFSLPLLARLSRVPNIVAVKNPAGDVADVVRTLDALRATTAPGFSLGVSVDWNATEAMLAGADGWYSVLGGLFPQVCMRIVSAVRTGDHATARQIDADLRPLWDLFTAWSSLRVIHAAVNHLGLCRVAAPLPILPLPDAAQQQVAQTLDRLGLE